MREIVFDRTCRLVPFGSDVPPPVSTLCSLHTQLLPRSPIAQLGLRFMRFYYQYLTRVGAIFGAVAYVNGQAAGFIVVTRHSDTFMDVVVRKRWFQLSWILLLALLCAPRRLGVLLEGWRIKWYRSRDREPGAAYGEILSFGVLPDYRGGKHRLPCQTSASMLLIKWGIKELSRGPVEMLRVVVDADNLPAQLFYSGLGWKLSRGQVPGWRTPSVEFTLPLDGQPKCLQEAA